MTSTTTVPAITPATPNLPVKPPVIHPPDHFGTLTSTFLGKFPVLMDVRPSGFVGAADGYATLEQARASLGALSKGSARGALAIVSSGDRFFGERVRGFAFSSRDRGHAIDIEHPHPDLGQTFAGWNSVVGLVDGDGFIYNTSQAAGH